MSMKVPDNRVPMVGMKAQYGYFGMDGMLTLVKVRDQLTDYPVQSKARRSLQFSPG